MQDQDWIDFKNATHCHIFEKALITESFLDSVTKMRANIAGRHIK